MRFWWKHVVEEKPSRDIENRRKDNRKKEKYTDCSSASAVRSARAVRGVRPGLTASHGLPWRTCDAAKGLGAHSLSSIASETRLQSSSYYLELPWFSYLLLYLWAAWQWGWRPIYPCRLVPKIVAGTESMFHKDALPRCVKLTRERPVTNFMSCHNSKVLSTTKLWEQWGRND